MSLGTFLKDMGSGTALHVAKGRHGHYGLVVETQATIHSRFQSISLAAAATTTMITVSDKESIIITDILIAAQKKAASTFLLQFTDGVDTEVMFVPDIVNQPVNFGIALAGGWQAWLGADFQVVTAGTFNYTVTIGFYKVTHGLQFADWDGLR